MSDLENPLINGDIKIVMDILHELKSGHRGQYKENVLKCCEERFGWEMGKTLETLEICTNNRILNSVTHNGKESYRFIENSSNDNVVTILDTPIFNETNEIQNMINLQEDSINCDADINSLQSDFIEFKKHVLYKIDEMYISFEKKMDTILNCKCKNPSYNIDSNKILISELNSKITILERELQNKQVIIEKMLDNRVNYNTSNAYIINQKNYKNDVKQHNSNQKYSEKDVNNSIKHVTQSENPPAMKNVTIIGDSLLKGLKSKGLSSE